MISVTARVVEQALQRAVAEHVVGELGGEPDPLLGAERDVLLLDDLVELAEHDGAQRVLAEARVVHPAAHALEQRLADAVLEARERVGGRARSERRPAGGRHHGGGGAPGRTTAHGRRGPPGGGRRGPSVGRPVPGPVLAGLHERGRREAGHQALHLLGHGVAPVARDERDALVGGRRHRLDRGRTTSTPVPIASSTSRTVRPPLGSAKFMTTCRPAGIMHSSRSTSSSLRSPRTPGTSMLVSITTSVARSRAARVCADRPGAVSTTT